MNIVEHNLFIDHSMFFSMRIGLGCYDYVDPYFNMRNYPIPCKKNEGEVLHYLVCFEELIETSKIERQLQQEGLRLATSINLLTLGAAHKEMQTEFPIAALGSSCELGSNIGLDRFESFSPVICGNPEFRRLDLILLDRFWSPHFRFLAL